MGERGVVPSSPSYLLGHAASGTLRSPRGAGDAAPAGQAADVEELGADGIVGDECAGTEDQQTGERGGCGAGEGGAAYQQVEHPGGGDAARATVRALRRRHLRQARTGQAVATNELGQQIGQRQKAQAGLVVEARQDGNWYAASDEHGLDGTLRQGHS
ncbi:hypothetical protein [Streptomyces sp. NPDC051554]|uniref:hypothetical protein n=1 Tax=Streptomyces sp. NPDC051554 TaxID=3365656 RepID=UPI003794E304